MSKGYWIATYIDIKDPAKLEAYAAMALPAITGAGGTFLARGMPDTCLLYTSPSPRDKRQSRMPSSA